MSFRISMVVLALFILAGYQQVKSQGNGSDDGFDLVDKTGNIRKPSNYRTSTRRSEHIRCSIRRGTKCTSPTPHPVRLSTTAKMEGLPMARCW